MADCKLSFGKIMSNGKGSIFRTFPERSTWNYESVIDFIKKLAITWINNLKSRDSSLYQSSISFPNNFKIVMK